MDCRGPERVAAGAGTVQCWIDARCGSDETAESAADCASDDAAVPEPEPNLVVVRILSKRPCSPNPQRLVDEAGEYHQCPRSRDEGTGKQHGDASDGDRQRNGEDGRPEDVPRRQRIGEVTEDLAPLNHPRAWARELHLLWQARRPSHHQAGKGSDAKADAKAVTCAAQASTEAQQAPPQAPENQSSPSQAPGHEATTSVKAQGPHDRARRMEAEVVQDM
mmetsp:Transcript_87096/g.244317  ORF Transcript_87096/g.244317 Transcript_87096/m.244317 type:complete len:220 (-) Transcript_87096:584-1243(-)